MIEYLYSKNPNSYNILDTIEYVANKFGDQTDSNKILTRLYNKNLLIEKIGLSK